MSGKSPPTRFLECMMNPYGNRTRCIVSERSSAFGQPGCVCASSKAEEIGTRRWHQG